MARIALRLPVMLALPWTTGWLCLCMALGCRNTDAAPTPAPAEARVEREIAAQPAPSAAPASPKPPPAVAQPDGTDRDITVPPPDVDVHVINGRNIFSALLRAGSAAAGEPPVGKDAQVRVTFWTTPDGQKLDTPQLHEGTLGELQLSALDLPMLASGEKRRFWIPGPTGMATLDVEGLMLSIDAVGPQVRRSALAPNCPSNPCSAPRQPQLGQLWSTVSVPPAIPISACGTMVSPTLRPMTMKTSGTSSVRAVAVWSSSSPPPSSNTRCVKPARGQTAKFGDGSPK